MLRILFLIAFFALSVGFPIFCFYDKFKEIIESRKAKKDRAAKEKQEKGKAAQESPKILYHLSDINTKEKLQAFAKEAYDLVSSKRYTWERDQIYKDILGKWNEAYWFYNCILEEFSKTFSEDSLTYQRFEATLSQAISHLDKQIIKMVNYLKVGVEVDNRALRQEAKEFRGIFEKILKQYIDLGLGEESDAESKEAVIQDLLNIVNELPLYKD